jgi:hypothetical protein
VCVCVCVCVCARARACACMYVLVCRMNLIDVSGNASMRLELPLTTPGLAPSFTDVDIGACVCMRLWVVLCGCVGGRAVVMR